MSRSFFFLEMFLECVLPLFGGDNLAEKMILHVDEVEDLNGPHSSRHVREWY
jgi:hypothetical protein